MNSKNKNSNDYINPDFADLFTFSSEEDEINSEARLISFHFLSEIERVYGSKRGMKANLAKETDNSKSFITQLFNGDKFVNFPLLAKIQKLLRIKFEIRAVSNYVVGSMEIPVQQTKVIDINDYLGKRGNLQSDKSYSLTPYELDEVVNLVN